MGVLILVLVGTIYYESLHAQMLSSHRLAMQLESESYVPRLKTWLESGHDLKTFPADLAYKTALYGYDKDFLVGNIRTSPENFNDNIALANAHVHLIIPLSPYGLGEYYLVFETPDDELWKRQFVHDSLLYGSLLFLVFALIGYTLSRMFLRPMNDAIALLDDFIKDTTHELNTPLSAILTNVEALRETDLPPSTLKKLARIEIASKTISTLYDDLTYLVLNHDLAYKDEDLDLSLLLHERIEYFNDRIDQKKLLLKDEGIVAEVHLTIDAIKAVRLIDNLLSNAIKYTRPGGTITLALEPGRFCVADTGIGIPRPMLERVFERYTRADKSVGGFGIGLHIVAMIARHYGLDIGIDSQEGEGTTICLIWKP